MAALTDAEAHESLAAYWRVIAARKYVVLSVFALGTDAAVLASAVDGAVLVVRAAHTSRAAASRGRRALEAAGCTVVSAVLNDQRPVGGTYGAGYG